MYNDITGRTLGADRDRGDLWGNRRLRTVIGEKEVGADDVYILMNLPPGFCMISLKFSWRNFLNSAHYHSNQILRIFLSSSEESGGSAALGIGILP